MPLPAQHEHDNDTNPHLWSSTSSCQRRHAMAATKPWNAVFLTSAQSKPPGEAPSEAIIVGSHGHLPSRMKSYGRRLLSVPLTGSTWMVMKFFGTVADEMLSVLAWRVRYHFPLSPPPDVLRSVLPSGRN